MAEQPNVNVVQAFDGLVDAFGKAVKAKTGEVAEKIKEKRLAQLAADLEELNKRKSTPTE